MSLVPLKCMTFKKHMVQTFHDNRFTICKLPRQSGKSTIIIVYLLHYVLFNPNVNVAILANKSSTARDILGRLQLDMNIYLNGYNKVKFMEQRKFRFRKWSSIAFYICKCDSMVHITSYFLMSLHMYQRH